MSSVLDSEKCEHCGGIVSTEYNCRTNENYKFCNRCGFIENYVIVRDEDGEPVLDKDGLMEFKTESLPGFGCLAFYKKGGIGVIYPLDKPYDESARQAFFAELNNPQLDPDRCYFTRWDFDTKQVVSVYGNIPPTYDEAMEESEESEDPE